MTHMVAVRRRSEAVEDRASRLKTACKRASLLLQENLEAIGALGKTFELGDGAGGYGLGDSTIRLNIAFIGSMTIVGSSFALGSIHLLPADHEGTLNARELHHDNRSATDAGNSRQHPQLLTTDTR